MPQKFLYFDTETTDIQVKDLIQLAFVTDSDVCFNEFYKPVQEISFGAMAIHHITPEMLENVSTFENAKLPDHDIDPDFKGNTLKEYLEFLANEYIWVAHNAEFDLEVLQKKGIQVPKYICTLKLARNFFHNGDYDLESYSLQYLRYSLGLYKNENKDHITAHDALSDVYFLRDLFHYMLENSKFTPEQMMLISKEPQFIRQVNFGKYAGRTLEDIARMDRAYLEWIESTMTDKPDLVWNARRVLNI